MTHSRIAICSVLAIFACFAAVGMLGPYLAGSEIIAPTPSAAMPVATPAIDDGAVASSFQEHGYCSFYGERWNQELTRSLAAGKGRIKTTAGFGDRYNAIVRLIRKYSRVDEDKQTINFANVDNAAYLGPGKKADGSARIKRQVLFNNNFLQSLLAFIIREGANAEQAGFGGIRTDWPVVSVFAHMVGHYVAQHHLKKGAQPFEELQADWFTGYILKRMGAGEQASVYMIERFGPVQGSGTHPSRADRVAAVQAGYTYACEIQKDGCQASLLDFQFNFPRPQQNLKASPNWPPKFDQVCTISGEQILIDRKYGFVFLRRFLTGPAARANGTRFPVRLPSNDAGSRDAKKASCRFNITAEEIGLVCVRYDGTVVPDASSTVQIGRCQSCDTPGLCPQSYEVQPPQ